MKFVNLYLTPHLKHFILRAIPFKASHYVVVVYQLLDREIKKAWLLSFKRQLIRGKG